MIKRIVWFVVFLALAASCLDDPDCFGLNNTSIGIAFRIMGTTRPDTVIVRGIRVSGTDSVFIDQSAYTRVTVPLNYLDNQSQLTLLLGEAETKSLLLRYNNATQFVSEECGARFFVNDIQAISHDFDSIRITNPSAANRPGTNIEVFRCPRTNLMRISFRQLTIATNGATSSTFVDHLIVKDGLLNPVDTVRTVVYGLSPTSTGTTIPLGLWNAYEVPGMQPEKSLSISYNVTDEMRFDPCGSQPFFSNLTITEHNFDSASVVRDADGRLRSSLTEPANTNIQLYRCPETNLIRLQFRTPTTGTATRAIARDIASIIADHLPDETFYANTSISIATLPLDSESNTTTFRITYADGSVDVVPLSYTRGEPRTFFRACGSQRLITALTEVGDLPYMRVVPTATAVQFPPVTNVEIIR